MPSCSIQTCDTASFCKGFCSRHYWQVKRYGEVLWTSYCGNIYVEGPEFALMACGQSYSEPTWFKVDLASVEKLRPYRWYADQYGYAATIIKGKRVVLHRFLFDLPYRKGLVDHKYGDKSDNRISELRLATGTENSLNSYKIRGKNPRRGIHWNWQRGKWLAHMSVSGKKVLWKEFKVYADAVKARESLEAIYLPSV